MNAQDEMQVLLRDIQTQIQAKGQAKVQADEPGRMHRRLYKAMKRRGWQMRLSHDDHSVFVILRSFK